MGSGEAIPGSCAIRRPCEGCGVFGVRSEAVSACTVHPVRLEETAGTPLVAGFPASGHGPCHRPACPSCHGGQAQVGEGRFLPAVSPRPRRRPLGNGVVAFVVPADPNLTARFCPVCLSLDTLSEGLIPAVVALLSASSRRWTARLSPRTSVLPRPARKHGLRPPRLPNTSKRRHAAMRRTRTGSTSTRRTAHSRRSVMR